MERQQTVRLDWRQADRAPERAEKGGRKALEDQTIIELYWRRDEEAVRATAEKYGGYCRSIARNFLADRRDQEECVNDTWVGAWNAMPPHRPGRLRLFLGKITRSLACDALRSQTAAKRGGGAYPEALEELSECLPAASDVDRAVEGRELERLINRFLHTLPERACGVFLRRYWYAEPLEAIAERCGMGEGAVKSSLFRTRRKLRAYLEKEGIAL